MPDCRRSRRRASTESGRSSSSFWALATARCAPPRSGRRGSRPRSGSARSSGSTRCSRGSAPSPPQATSRAVAAPSTSAASERQERASSLTVLQALGQRVRQARGADRGRGAGDVVLACAASGRSRRSVSSSSQAARASPSRGWPTLPGLRIHSPSATSTSSPPRRAEPVAGSPSGRTKESATCEWPTSDRRSGWASRHSSASRAERTYSQTGIARRRVVEPDAAHRSPRASATPASRDGRRR